MGRNIFCGGGGQTLYLRSYLIRELLELTDLQKFIDKYEIGFTKVPPEYNINSSWLGGSIIFSLTVAKNFFTNSQQFRENGNDIDSIDDKLAQGIKEGKE